jgi:hypothetical protein
MRRPASRSPGAVADDDAVADCDTQLFRGEQKNVGSGLGVFDVVASDYRYGFGEAQTFYGHFGLSALTTGGDSPRQANFGQVLQEFARASKYADGFYFASEIFGVAFFKTLDGGGICRVTYFPQKTGQEKGTAHPDAAVDFPVGNVHAEVGEGFMLGQDVLISAVDQRVVQIEKHGRKRDGVARRSVVRVRMPVHRNSFSSTISPKI